MGATDQVLANYMAEIEERQTFVDGIFKAANGKDLSDEQLEIVKDQKAQMEKVNAKIEPLIEMRRISGDSAQRVAEIAKYMNGDAHKAPDEVEYRSAGHYLSDYLMARGGGNDDAANRLRRYTEQRTAAHQITTDNPGLLPTPILGSVINFIDASRPLTTWLGPMQIPSNSWTRPKVTQHTSVAAQPTGEKNELVSQKMTITKTAVTANTYGGYVNVSRQDIDWTSPQIMDIVINDLAAKYGTVTEAALGAAVQAAAPTSTTIPTGTATTAAVTAAIWKAASEVYTATAGQGRVAMFMPPDQLLVYGPLFAPVNPQNAQSAGFNAADFGTGAVGQISGIPVYVTAGLTAGSSVLVSSAAVEVYEDRIGSLQVIEPSVLGVQVAYAGYYTWLIVETTGVQEIVKTP